MGKVKGRQLTLPASLNQRVNLHRGHNGFSLAKTTPHAGGLSPAMFLSADPPHPLFTVSLRPPSDFRVRPRAEPRICTMEGGLIRHTVCLQI